MYERVVWPRSLASGVKRKELSGRVVRGTWTGPRVGHMRIKGKNSILGFPARETRKEKQSRPVLETWWAEPNSHINNYNGLSLLYAFLSFCLFIQLTGF